MMDDLYWFRYWRDVFTVTGSSTAYDCMVERIRLSHPWPDRFTFIQEEA